MNRRNLIQASSFLPSSVQRSVRSVLNLYPKSFRDKKGISVYPTGIPELDEVTQGGFEEKSINLFLGKSSCGKTALMNRIHQSTNYCQVFSGCSIEEIIKEAKQPVLLIDDFEATISHSPSDTSFNEKAYSSVEKLYDFAVRNNLAIVAFQTVNRRIYSEFFLEEIQPYVLIRLSSLVVVVDKINYEGHGKLIVEKNYFASRREIAI